MTDQTDVLILGAGLAGLAAGHELTKKSDKKVTLLEKNLHVGGLAVTMRKNGYAFDSGPHRWFTKSDEIDTWMKELMSSELKEINRLTRIYYKGKYYNYPLKPLNALRNLGLLNAIHAMLSYAFVRMQLKLGLKSAQVNNIEDAYVNLFGHKLYEEFFHYYTEKLWGRSVKELSGDWVSQRAKGLNIWKAVQDSIIKDKNTVSLVDKFNYPKHGFGRIAEKMKTEILQNQSNQLHYGQDVAQINWQEQSGTNKITSITSHTTHHSQIYDHAIEISQEQIDRDQFASLPGQTIELQADHYISSIPITELVTRMQPQPPAQVLQAAQTLTFRDEIHVVLMLNKGHFTPDNWVYTQDNKLLFVRLMEMDTWSDELAPPGHTSIVFEIACQEGDQTWLQTDQELVDMVAQNYINEFHYFEMADIVDSYVHRIPKEYPVYDLGYQQKVQVIKDFLGTFANLQIIGRNGTFKYNNSDHSCQMGLYAARNILGANYDLEKINTDRAYHEVKEQNKS
jgi:protoporphyrinogen oxidase